MRQDNKDAVDKRKRIIESQDPGAVREQAGVFSLIASEQTITSAPLAVSVKPGRWSTIWRILNAMGS